MELIEKKTNLLYESLKNGGTCDGEPEPVSITPFYFPAKKYKDLCVKLELIMDAIEIVLQLYRVDKQVQNYYPEIEHLKNLIFIDYDTVHPSQGRLNHLSRFDFIENENGDFGILEFNTGYPGCVLSSPCIKRIFESLQLINDSDKNNTILCQTDDNLFFFHYLIRLYQKKHQTQDLPTIAMVQNKNHYPLYTDEDQFLMLGKEQDIDVVSVPSYDQLVYNGKYLTFQDKKIDVIWNKYAVGVENGKVRPHYYTTSPDEAKDFVQAVKDQNIITVNGFPSFFISENKKTMALLYDSSFHRHFTNDQIAAIRSLILPTYVLKSQDQEFLMLKESFIKLKDEYVIKGSCDARGKSIFIGKTTDQDQWNALIEKCVDGPYIIQSFIKSSESMVVCPRSKKEVSMKTTIAMFMVGGRASGILCRSSPSLIQNMMSNGIMQYSIETTEHLTMAEYNPLKTIYTDGSNNNIIQPQHKYMFGNRYLWGFQEDYINELDGSLNRDEYRVIIKRVNRICSQRAKLVVFFAVPLYLIKAIVFLIIDRKLPLFFLDFLQFLQPLALVIGWWYYQKYKIPQRNTHYMNQINTKYGDRGLEFTLDIEKGQPPVFSIKIGHSSATPKPAQEYNLVPNQFNASPQLPFPAPQQPPSLNNNSNVIVQQQIQQYPYVLQQPQQQQQLHVNNQPSNSQYSYPQAQMYMVVPQQHQQPYMIPQQQQQQQQIPLQQPYSFSPPPYSSPQPFIDSAHPATASPSERLAMGDNIHGDDEYDENKNYDSKY
ncbi:hypothetical protein CYY_009266 [Polysphondylium violaceum]|uniref:Uncharacterized protein n=1 Tax=Polysphondylium violaceum TaxID=133409 RepID=A0A8J4V355_9MYCE|nr:hypothetical protein CYY_009266 [Polysphondylium violaceum]